MSSSLQKMEKEDTSRQSPSASINCSPTNRSTLVVRMPFDFVMAGLGACTSMTLRMYAERREFPLTHLSVSLSYDKVTVDGVARDHIQRTITLEGELSDEQRQRLLEIANKCPVHRALSQSLLIDSAIAT